MDIFIKILDEKHAEVCLLMLPGTALDISIGRSSEAYGQVSQEVVQGQSQ